MLQEGNAMLYHIMNTLSQYYTFQVHVHLICTSYDTIQHDALTS